MNSTSRSPFVDVNEVILIVKQLPHNQTHISLVHILIGIEGAIVHIPLSTVAVQIVAPPLQYAKFTNVHSTDHVQLIHGY